MRAIARLWRFRRRSSSGRSEHRFWALGGGVRVAARLVSGRCRRRWAPAPRSWPIDAVRPISISGAWIGPSILAPSPTDQSVSVGDELEPPEPGARLEGTRQWQL